MFPCEATEANTGKDLSSGSTGRELAPGVDFSRRACDSARRHFFLPPSPPLSFFSSPTRASPPTHPASLHRHLPPTHPTPLHRSSHRRRAALRLDAAPRLASTPRRSSPRCRAAPCLAALPPRLASPWHLTAAPCRLAPSCLATSPHPPRPRLAATSPHPPTVVSSFRSPRPSDPFSPHPQRPLLPPPPTSATPFSSPLLPTTLFPPPTPATLFPSPYLCVSTTLVRLGFMALWLILPLNLALVVWQTDLGGEAGKLYLHTWGLGFLFQLHIYPGNIEMDLQSRAQHKYELFWIILVASCAALVIQSMAANLGVVTIIGTAFALNMLFNIPVWICVLLTGLSTMIILALQQYGVRKFLIAFLVFTIAACFMADLGYAKPNAKKVLKGLFIPELKRSGVIGLAISLLGAMVMSHILFLHSALVLSRKIPPSVRGIKVDNFFPFGFFNNLIDI
ncbi:hypothetical protein Fmac_001483 [Flemingia macrophylla]|uniref:Uncharacterized protein n=1 Tax=Flemingia macrophylla TaxID=520843 RepID=A0ABD1NHZ2_9FABA